MTPTQKIKWAILTNATVVPLPYPLENVDELYDKLVEQDAHWDAKNEVRRGTVDTKLEPDYSRHYESRAVAMKMPDNSWVGWTYWFGGGKHGEPEAMEWMESAYDLTCTEEEKTLIVQTFKKTVV